MILKTTILTLCLLSVSLFPTVVNSDNPISFEFDSTQENLGTVHKGQRFSNMLGLFGAGQAELRSDQMQASFDQFYEYCKSNGNPEVANVSTLTENIKIALRRFKLHHQVNLNQYSFNGQNFESILASDETMTQFIQEYKDALLCDKQITADDDGEGFATGQDIVVTQNAVAFTPIAETQYGFRSGIGAALEYTFICYQNTPAGRLLRDRNLHLMFMNLDTVAAFTDSDTIQDFLDYLFFSYSLTQNHINNLYEADNIYMPTLFRQRIEPFLPSPDLEVSQISVQSLNEGLGHVCSQIYNLQHSGQANASNIESCIRSHVSTVISSFDTDDTEFDSGICGAAESNGHNFCRIRPDFSLIGVTSLGGPPGKVNDDIYTFSDLSYCSSISETGHLEPDGNAYNWGTFDAVSDVPYLKTRYEGAFSLNRAQTSDRIIVTAQLRNPASGNSVNTLKFLKEGNDFLFEASIPASQSQSSVSSSSLPVLQQSQTNPGLKTSTESGAVSKYCFQVKAVGNDAEYFFILPTTGENRGQIQTYLVESSNNGIRSIELSENNTVTISDTVLEKQETGDCDYN